MNARISPLRFVVFASFIALSTTAAFALDPGEDGVRVTIPVSGIADYAQGGVLDPNGSLVMVGSAGGNYSVLARITSTGGLDGSFGTLGVANNDLSPSLGDGLRAVARLSNGEYIGCGVFFHPGTANDFVVARFASNGALDTSFNGVGYATTAFLDSGSGGVLTDQCNAVVVQPLDGYIVAAGVTAADGPPHVALARYTANGAPDLLFGTNGKLDLSAAATVNGASEAHAVALQNDGKILVAGYAFGPGNSEFLLLRLTTAGVPDGSFGTGGIVRTPVGAGEDIANAIVVQPDGRIVIAGSTIVADGRRDFALARYTTAGVLDGSFGTGGLVITPIGPSDDIVNALALMPWGRIVAAGSARVSTTTSGNDVAVAAYNADGTLDKFFGIDGKRMVNVSNFDDIAYGVIPDITGERFWIVGTAEPTTNQDFLAMEFGLPDTIFRHDFDSATAA